MGAWAELLGNGEPLNAFEQGVIDESLLRMI